LPFGHGLSYTTFKISQLELVNEGKNLNISVLVENTGKVDGSEVVQVYGTQCSLSVKRPAKELKGFARAHIKAEESKKVTVFVQQKYFTSFWDEGRDMWISENDTYDVLVGRSSTPLKISFEIVETRWWSGL
jgi:beta-glucosidase